MGTTRTSMIVKVIRIIQKRKIEISTITTKDGITKTNVLIQMKKNSIAESSILSSSSSSNVKETMKAIDVNDDSNTIIMGYEISNDISILDSWFNNSDILSIEPDYPVSIDYYNHEDVTKNNRTTKTGKEIYHEEG